MVENAKIINNFVLTLDLSVCKFGVNLLEHLPKQNNSGIIW